MEFNPGQFDDKWQKVWEENALYHTSNDTDKPKYYVLDMFPYPSGAGLHVGHPLGYIASDIISRYKRQKGFNVLHPMGYDSIGLPAEQYAIQMGVHPYKSTTENIKRYRKQLDNIGLSFDWSRQVRTDDPSYYKWTQWIFIQLFEHYYDLKEDKAKSISELVKLFETQGNSQVSAYHTCEFTFDGVAWNSMNEAERQDILMNYRLAYRKVGYVNWCEELGSVLANDEVKDGVSERGGYPVEKKPMMQWSLRITAYAERLLKGIDEVEWSHSLKTMQKNWIGRSEGAQMFFEVVDQNERLEIFTTRPDTIFGATFMVLAPEHDLVDVFTLEEQKEKIAAYKKYVGARSEVERMSEVKEVTGAFTGSYALNPFNGNRIPIYISEYVLKDYGTGAIMAVPSDDERDQAFANKFSIPIIDVIDKSKYPGATLSDKVGILINSDFLDGKEVPVAIQEMFSRIEKKGIGRKKINYKLRDANFSRQRYWGEPIPILYGEKGEIKSMDIKDLPLELPYMDNIKPEKSGKSPLAKNKEWVDCGYWKRETDTMPGYAGSSWYFLRYMDPQNNQGLASKEAMEYWQNVDLYIGGTEHAVGHLLYSRFWTKFLYDLSIAPIKEPFQKLVNQGMIQGVIEYIHLKKEKVDGKSIFVSAEMIDTDKNIASIPVHIDFVSNYGNDDSYLSKEGIQSFIKWRPDFKGALFQSDNGIFNIETMPSNFQLKTTSEVGKMSKRYFNVVNPDDVSAKYGADCFRMYEMFLGPLEQSKPWDTNGIDGVYKFLRKLWSLFYDENGAWRASNNSPTPEEMKVLHNTIKKVSDDIERLSFNTAVSSFMVCVNELKKSDCSSISVLEPLLKLLAPFAPFITEELFQKLGNESSIHLAEYPIYEEKYTVEDSIEYPICINGKKRDSIKLSTDLNKDEIEAMVLAMESLNKWIEGKKIRKVIIVPKRMINLVV